MGLTSEGINSFGAITCAFGQDLNKTPTPPIESNCKSLIIINLTLDKSELIWIKLFLICLIAGVAPMLINVKFSSSKINVAVFFGKFNASPSTIYVFSSVC